MSQGSNESTVVLQPEPVSQQQGAPPEAETWSVVRVADGDTITARLGGREERIRFACIDAPESDQPLGAESGRRLQQLIDQAGGQVDLVVTDSDRYGRLIAEVYASGSFAQEVLVSEGLAWSYRRYHANCPSADRINQVEAIAQQQQVGVFSGSHVEPWEWRRQ
jgi:endonuclease YncB( thermonuclease family)